LTKLKLLSPVIEYEDPYEDKLLKLIEKAYRKGDMKLFRKLAKLYEEGINTLDFKKAYLKARKLVKSRQ